MKNSMNNKICVGYLTNIRDMFVIGSKNCEGEALEYQHNFINALNYAIELINDKERPKGKWIKIFENPYTNGYVCPFCGHKIQVTEQFLLQVTECEACGADMRGGES